MVQKILVMILLLVLTVGLITTARAMILDDANNPGFTIIQIN